MDTERWRPARGYAGFYEISDAGNVSSLRRAGSAGGPVTIHRNSRGYLVVTLSRYGVARTVLVARLVLEAFDSPAQGRRVRYGPKGKASCALANLSWR
jgi:NUMOD4 motif